MLLVHGKTAGWMASGNSALMTKAHVKSLSENEAPISGSTPAANKLLLAKWTNHKISTMTLKSTISAIRTMKTLFADNAATTINATLNGPRPHRPIGLSTTRPLHLLHPTRLIQSSLVYSIIVAWKWKTQIYTFISKRQKTPFCKYFRFKLTLKTGSSSSTPINVASSL